MTNVFLNSLQLNDSTITCNITGHKLEKDYTNQSKDIYSRFSPLQYNTAGGVEKYQFEFTLWTKSNTYFDLLIKQENVYNELKTQIVNRIPLRISTDDTFIAANYMAADVLVEDATFDITASNGVNHLNFVLDCIVVKLLSDSDLHPFIGGWEAFEIDEGRIGEDT